jgi:hypothetical protein
MDTGRPLPERGRRLLWADPESKWNRPFRDVRAGYMVFQIPLVRTGAAPPEEND